MPKNCYQIFDERYRAACPEIRGLIKIYWLKCHQVILESGRTELINFTSRIVALIAMIDSEKQQPAAA